MGLIAGWTEESVKLKTNQYNVESDEQSVKYFSTIRALMRFKVISNSLPYGKSHPLENRREWMSHKNIHGN